jgi:5-methylthioribose kinase
MVLLVEIGSNRFVVKQPRRQLMVKDEWLAKPERALTEARALRFTRELTPGAVPLVFDVDEQACAMTMQASPPAWRTWKELLLEGDVDPSTGGRLGTLLGGWHRSSSLSLDQLVELRDLEIFEQLRIEPFHRTVASRHPELAPRVNFAAEALVAVPGRCLVHGDFSPKNVLVGAEGLWVIDFEVAHVGNPVFDLAFLLAHLILKSIHRPGSAAAYRDCAAQFLQFYEESAGEEFMPSDESLSLHVGCLLLARVDGKSPAEYLTTPERKGAWRVGASFVKDPAHPLSRWPYAGGEDSR